MKNIIFLILVLTVVVASFYIFLSPGVVVPEVEGVESFSSEQEFKSYLEESSGLEYLGASVIGGAFTTRETAQMPTAVGELTDGGVEPSRVSTTTVQVVGIDEPDIVKTDGKEIYFSSQSYRPYWGGFSVPYYYQGEIKVVKAFPPTDLEIETDIERNGDLLLYNGVLIVFSSDRIYGYDVSNPESPTEDWKVELNSSIVGARLFGGKIYLITRKTIDYYYPCPITPVSRNGIPVVIECSRVYHPTTYVPVDVTYNVMVLNPGSGTVEKAVSFIGSSALSVVYMSENAVYVTYSYVGDIVTIYSNFLKEKCSDLIPSYVIEKVEKLKDYDISITAKMTELQIILEQYRSSLSSDDRLRLDNEMNDRMEDYVEEHKREIMKTGIAKIGLDMEVLSSGNVPGTPLNQFSLDEYENHLRIATTISVWWGGESANDVYVLDRDLKIVGSVIDLGLEERIYSVRFLQDKGYMVTFRQIDPFFVLDLSNPTKPEVKGELKIPGYSSYLHPITKDKILGIGKDGSYVKLSLFDVYSAENPQEKDKYSLSEYWTDVLNTHHAFLLDDKHEIFFLPGSKGGYVFSYEDDDLELVKAVSDVRARRAIYIEDYLYIIGDNEIVVLDENSWEKVNDIEF